MTRIVGLDTGGTYTDGVLFDPQRGVLRAGKALTTRHDLSVGLASVLEQVLAGSEADVDLVCLSTTLATNAVVEGHGSPIGLLLIGLREEASERSRLAEVLGGDPVAFIRGGHDVFGREKQPLDADAVLEAIERMAPRVAGFAIAGMFAVRNPEHECSVRDQVIAATSLPVTCSHELSSKLDAPRRAVTTVLNARLIPALQQLIEAVRLLLEQREIRAPLMVVKGDGSLEDVSVALRRPVETILSGPAASLVGAHYLSNEANAVVVDMGGTTTDVALLEDGVPVINESGAKVAGWSTMVEAISIHTSGLGGDSEVHVAPDGSIEIGPRRCVPVSLLADRHPGVLETLEGQLAGRFQTEQGRFALQLRGSDVETLPDSQRQLWQALAEGPVAVRSLQDGGLTGHALDMLVNRGCVILAGFTPSDACHVLGKQVGWFARAAKRAAQLAIRAQKEGVRPTSVEAFARRVLEAVTRQSGRSVVAALIAEASDYDLEAGGELGRALVDWSVAPRRGSSSLLRPVFEIDRPVVAIGAPAATYYPEVAERLGVRLVVPAHAEIANAVGAAAAGVMQVVRVLISRPDQNTYRVHLPGEVRDLSDSDEAVALASRCARSAARERAEEAGAVDVQVSETARKRIYHSESGQEILLEAIVSAKAVGRPRLERASG